MSEQSIINPQFFERRADRPFEVPLAKVSGQTFPHEKLDNRFDDEGYHVCGNCGEELMLTVNGYKCIECGMINFLGEMTVELLCFKGKYITTEIIKPIF
jgi:hypothetical protein